MKTVISALVGPALLIACASSEPLRTQTLEQARAEVQTLSQNPAATEVASRELASSRDLLSQAEDALKRKHQEDLDHYSYLALHKAWTGEARIAERDARRRVAQGEAERNRVLLEARNAELEARKRLAAQQTERGMVLTLSGVLFDTGKTTLKPGAAPTLDRVSQFMTQYPGTRVIVEGHTDSQGSEASNQELSQQRAEAVTDALVLRGVPRDRIEAMGRGEALPIASNETAAGRQQNRRVEMVFSDASGRFAESATGIRR